MPGATAGAQCLTMASARSDPDDNLAEIASVDHTDEVTVRFSRDELICDSNGGK
jgi:hypothetical protein